LIHHRDIIIDIPFINIFIIESSTKVIDDAIGSPRPPQACQVKAVVSGGGLTVVVMSRWGLSGGSL
jgi:hypothetical protein